MLDTQYLIRILECFEEGCVQAAVYVLLSYAGVLLVPHISHCLLHLLGRSISHDCHCSSFCFILVLCRVIASPSRLSIIH